MIKTPRNRFNGTKLSQVSSAALAVAICLSGTSAAQEENRQNQDDELVADVVVVKGLRQSLEDAVNIKRNSNSIVDAISAEDIGAFPDQDLSESLQRITGIQIARNPTNSNEVQLRGLSQFRIELNNRALVSAGAQRNINFETVPSELISGIEVYKTPSADQIEGGIGGLVRLKSRRPTEQNDDLLSFTASADYGVDSEEAGHRISGIASKTFETEAGEFGVLLNIADSRNILRSDHQETRGFTQRGLTDTNGNPVVDSGGANLFAPNQYRILGWQPETERTSVNLALDWKPNQDTLVYFDGFYTDYLRDSQGTLLINAVTGGSRLEPGYTVSPNGTLISGAYQNVRTDTHGRSEIRDNEIGNYALGLEINKDKFDFETEVTYGDGEGGGLRFAQARYRRFGDRISFDISDLDEPYDYAIDADLNDASSFIFWNLVDLRQEQDNTEQSFRADLEYRFDNSPITSVKVGTRFTDSEVNGGGSQFNSPIRYSTVGGSVVEPGNPGSDRTIPITDFANLIAGEFAFPDFLDSTDANVPQSFVHISPSVPASLDFLNAFGLNYADVAVEDLLATFTIEEQTSAIYAMGNFDFDLGGRNAFGNFGVRVVQTDVSSTGNQNVGAGIAPISIENDYTEVLPALNFNYAWTQDVILRFSASRAMARPDLLDLSPRLFLNPGAQVGDAGNPMLNPFIANQFDVSAEWYFQPGSLFSVAYFYKDVEDFFQSLQQTETYFNIQTQTDTDFLVSRVRNGGEGTIKGLEFNFLHSFEDQLPAPFDGLGIQANYTYVDSETPIIESNTGAAQPLEDLSENSFNVVGFYEKGRYTVRLAYNWRDEYLNTTSTDGGTAEFRESIGYLDASLDVAVNDWLDFTVDATNLLDSPVRGFVGLEERPVFYAVDDTRVQVGLRARF